MSSLPLAVTPELESLGVLESHSVDIQRDGDDLY